MSEFLQPTRLQLTDAMRMLEHQHAYNWSEPGTGKTLTTLIAFRESGYKRMVVIGPPLSLGMWQEEVQTQLGLKAAVIRSGSISKERMAIVMTADVIITSYALATKPKVKEALTKFLNTWGDGSALVLDESHYLKTPGTKRTEAVFASPRIPPAPKGKRMPPPPADMMKVRQGLAHHADSVWQLTGTPQTRWPDDLYTQLSFGRPEVLRYYGVDRFDKFQREFCSMGSSIINGRRIERVVGARNLTRLKQLIESCAVIRRTLTEAAAELPGITHRPLIVPAPKIEGLADVNISDAELITALKNKDSPYASMYRKVGQAKIPHVLAHVNEEYIARGAQVVVGVWHVDTGKELTAKLSELTKKRVVFVYGGMKQEARDKIRDAYNAGEVQIIVGQMAAMETSWNLQGSGHSVVVAEEIPSPGKLEQFIGRTYRKGQKNHVQVDHIQLDHWLDKAVNRIRLAKAVAIKEIM